MGIFSSRGSFGRFLGGVGVGLETYSNMSRQRDRDRIFQEENERQARLQEARLEDIQTDNTRQDMTAWLTHQRDSSALKRDMLPGQAEGIYRGDLAAAQQWGSEEDVQNTQIWGYQHGALPPAQAAKELGFLQERSPVQASNQVAPPSDPYRQDPPSFGPESAATDMWTPPESAGGRDMQAEAEALNRIHRQEDTAAGVKKLQAAVPTQAHQLAGYNNRKAYADRELRDDAMLLSNKLLRAMAGNSPEPGPDGEPIPNSVVRVFADAQLGAAYLTSLNDVLAENDLAHLYEPLAMQYTTRAAEYRAASGEERLAWEHDIKQEELYANRVNDLYGDVERYWASYVGISGKTTDEGWTASFVEDDEKKLPIYRRGLEVAMDTLKGLRRDNPEALLSLDPVQILSSMEHVMGHHELMKKADVKINPTGHPADTEDWVMELEAFLGPGYDQVYDATTKKVYFVSPSASTGGAGKAWAIGSKEEADKYMALTKKMQEVYDETTAEGAIDQKGGGQGQTELKPKDTRPGGEKLGAAIREAPGNIVGGLESGVANFQKTAQGFADKAGDTIAQGALGFGGFATDLVTGLAGGTPQPTSPQQPMIDNTIHFAGTTKNEDLQKAQELQQILANPSFLATVFPGLTR